MPLPFLAAAAVKMAPVKAFLARIPRGVWIALAVLAILGLGTCAHKRSVKRFGDERYAAGVAHEQARIEAKAKELKAKADAASAKITEKLRTKHDETVTVIYRDADALRLHGSGKASCAPSAGVSSSSGRYDQASGQGSPALDQVSDRERVDVIGLPFAGTVALAETCDLNRSEVLTWREWHKQQSEAWAMIAKP